MKVVLGTNVLHGALLNLQGVRPGKHFDTHSLGELSLQA